ncbi:MAG: hypothetical protein Q9162_007515 [Coniocarpon cinnabarinum]
MRAARVNGFNGGYKIVDTDVPKDLGSNDVLIKIMSAGFCHTDLMVEQGALGPFGATDSMIGSHEPCGIAVALGSEAQKNGQIKPGDRVGTINPYGYCGKCDSCKLNKQYCNNLKGMIGVNCDGGFAEYVRADARVVSKIPESIPFEEAAPLFCAGATVYGAIKAVDVKPGEWVAILGVGGLGHLGIQYLKAMKANVVAIDNRKEALDLINTIPQHLRPDRSFLIDTDDARKKATEELSSSFYDTNPGIDKVVICADGSELIAWAQQWTRKGGSICDVGIPTDTPFKVDAPALSIKEHTIRGCLICSPEQCDDMVELHAKNQCKTYIEKTYSMDKINDMLAHYQSKNLKGRVCMVMS